jgi:hypothetical protein
MHVCAHSVRTYLRTLGAGERVQKHESARHERHVAPPHSRCPCRICSSTRGGPARTAPGLGSLLPHLRQDWARPCHICTKTAPTTFAPALGARMHVSTKNLHICTGTASTTATSVPGLGGRRRAFERERVRSRRVDAQVVRVRRPPLRCKTQRVKHHRAPRELRRSHLAAHTRPGSHLSGGSPLLFCASLSAFRRPRPYAPPRLRCSHLARATRSLRPIATC